MTDYVHINSPYDRGEADSAQNFRGERHLSSADAFTTHIAPITRAGDIVGDGAYQIPGSPALLNGNGTWGAFLPLSPSYNRYPMQNPDGYLYRDTLIYRSDTTGRAEGATFRLLPSSPTTPRARYRFMDGSRGDIYG